MLCLNYIMNSPSWNTYTVYKYINVLHHINLISSVRTSGSGHQANIKLMSAWMKKKKGMFCISQTRLVCSFAAQLEHVTFHSA